MSWSEDHTSREFVEKDLKGVQVSGIITKEMIVALRTGEMTGARVLEEIERKGKLENPGFRLGYEQVVSVGFQRKGGALEVVQTVDESSGLPGGAI